MSTPVHPATIRSRRWILYLVLSALLFGIPTGWVACLLANEFILPCFSETWDPTSVNEGVVRLDGATPPAESTWATWREPDGSSVRVCLEGFEGESRVVSYRSREGSTPERTVHAPRLFRTPVDILPVGRPDGGRDIAVLGQEKQVRIYQRFALGDRGAVDAGVHADDLPAETGSGWTQAAAVADLDGDGFEEIALLRQADSSPPALEPGGLLLHFLSGSDGAELFAFAPAEPGCRVLKLASLPDLDGDGSSELALGLERGRGEERKLEILILSSRDGREMRRIRGEDVGSKLIAFVGLVEDLDDDDVPELLLSAKRETLVVAPAGAVVLRRYASGRITPVGLADFDGDGEPDLLGSEYGGYDCLWAPCGSAAIVVLSGRTGERILCQRVATPFSRGEWCGDVDGNGTEDVLVESMNRGLLVLGRNSGGSK